MLYNVVADVKSYDQFIPYCQESTITETDAATGRPARAVLQVGWHEFTENFESKLSYDEHMVVAEAFNNQMFKSLYTRWTVKPLPAHPDRSAVEFELTFCFNSALYNTVSKNFGPTIAKIMIKAFTDRAKALEALSPLP